MTRTGIRNHRHRNEHERSRRKCESNRTNASRHSPSRPSVEEFKYPMRRMTMRSRPQANLVIAAMMMMVMMTAMIKNIFAARSLAHHLHRNQRLHPAPVRVRKSHRNRRNPRRARPILLISMVPPMSPTPPSLLFPRPPPVRVRRSHPRDRAMSSSSRVPTRSHRTRRRARSVDASGVASRRRMTWTVSYSMTTLYSRRRHPPIATERKRPGFRPNRTIRRVGARS